MGRTLTPQQEADQLRELIQQAHEVLKDLRKAMREAAAEAARMVANFEAIANREIGSMNNQLTADANRAAAQINESVIAAQQDIVRRLTISRLRYIKASGELEILFPGGMFDDHVPLPHPEPLPKEHHQ